MSTLLTVDLGAETCSSLDVAATREWLVTNGLGGFACGTVAGVLTRRYHGLLIAGVEEQHARDASDGIATRTLLVAKFDETVRYDGRSYELGANRWKSGGTIPVVAPEGFLCIQRFCLQGATPVWTFTCADALIEKRIWMQDGANTTYVRYSLVRSSTTPVELEVKAFVNYRNIHSTTTRADFPGAGMEITTVPHGLCVIARTGATPYFLLSDAAEAEPRHDWYLNFDLAEERLRGLGDREDHLLGGIFRARLAPGGSLTFVLSTDPEASLDGRAALASRVALEEKTLDDWIAAQPQASLDAPPWIRQLILAAAQFPIRSQPSPAANSVPGRNSADATGYSVIAGYPWFGEWGRDAMIALPGLTLETGQHDRARSILRRTATFVDQGMLPNVFPEAGQPAQYNSVDATLWYFDAVRQYHDATSDRAFIEELFPLLADMIDHYVRGTRYGIRVDQADGLLHAGEPGVQLTWMDAKVGAQVITPRIGKPVEVNALWYNALRTMAHFAFALGKPTWEFNRLADHVLAGFARFWNAQVGGCFDVLDGPADSAAQGAHDAAIRPNQIFAVSLPESPLGAEQRAAVVDLCMRRLLTPYGLRTLDPADPRYQGHYEGPMAQRDAAYHQGTVWPWLLGPFVMAHLRVHRDPEIAFTFIEPLAHHLLAYCLGTVSEIFDGDAPWTPRGALSQAWSVAQVLRAWRACHDAGFAARPLPRRL